MPFKFLRDRNLHPETTHLIIGVLKPTEKVLSALAKGIWILPQSYLVSVLRCSINPKAFYFKAASARLELLLHFSKSLAKGGDDGVSKALNAYWLVLINLWMPLSSTSILNRRHNRLW